MKTYKICCIVWIVIVVLVIFAIVLGLSFQGVEYYQYGFLRNRNTGKVDTDKVYTNGLYCKGPAKEFKTFPSDLQIVELDDLDVASKDSLAIKISVSFQYLLREDSLRLLHDEYDLEYEEIVEGSAKEAIKATTVLYETSVFIKERKVIEDALKEAVKRRIDDKCCSQTCPDKGEYCEEGCIPPKECQPSDRGIYLRVKYFQLLDIQVPSEVRDQSMQAIVLDADAERVIYEQEAAIVEKETEVIVRQITNEADEIKQNATAQAELIVAEAEANAKAKVEKARIDGLNLLFNATGITDPADKSTINYLRTLRTRKNTYISLGFDYLVRSP